MPGWFKIITEIASLVASLVIILGGIPAVWKFFKWLDADTKTKMLLVKKESANLLTKNTK